MDLRISSRSLTQILEYWHPTGRRIPVVYADGPDAILLSRQEKLEEDMSEAEFLCRFHPLATEGVRSYGVEVREEGLSFTKPFPPCRAPIRRGKTLLFLPGSGRELSTRKMAGGLLLQDKNLMGFARQHWGGKPLFRREMEGAVLISPHPIELAMYEAPEHFLPLDREISLRDRHSGRSFSPSGGRRKNSALLWGTNVSIVRSKRLWVTNTSGIRNVSRNRGLWMGKIGFSRRQFFLGRYADLADAAAVVREAEKARDEVVGQLDQLQDRAGQELERRLDKLLEDFRDKRAAAAGANEN